VVEDICVLPGSVEDSVYRIVKRTINGSTVRFIEKDALESQCTGLSEARLSDAHVISSGSTISGLGHLEGETVVAWGWDDDDTSGRNLGSHTVSGGAITLTESVDHCVVGLPYTAQFKSSKLAYGAQMGTALTQKKIVNQIALVLHNTHIDGIKTGRSFDAADLRPMPRTYRQQTMAADHIFEEYDEPGFTIPGKWDADSRLCLQSQSPYPCTVLGAVLSVTTHER
jgi:hypothetical protein